MKYIDVTWHHKNKNEPIRLVSELGDDNYELRKLEFFENKKIGFASENNSKLSTMLGEAPVPPLEKINSDSQFTGKYITSEEFESLWNNYANKNT